MGVGGPPCRCKTQWLIGPVITLKKSFDFQRAEGQVFSGSCQGFRRPFAEQVSIIDGKTTQLIKTMTMGDVRYADAALWCREERSPDRVKAPHPHILPSADIKGVLEGALQSSLADIDFLAEPANGQALMGMRIQVGQGVPQAVRAPGQAVGRIWNYGIEVDGGHKIIDHIGFQAFNDWTMLQHFRA